MRQPISQFSSALGHSFSNEGLLDQALTHRSSGAINNERLEFLGDALLDYVIADALYKRFPTASEGQLSRMRSILVRRDSLASTARSLNLGDYLNLGPGELRTGGHARPSILADALEAVFAAVYLDADADAARRIILNLLGPQLDALDLEEAGGKDSKTRLQEYLQARGMGLPHYEIIEVQGEAHAQHFRCGCTVSALDLNEEGEGGSRRKAEQSAASKVLARLDP